jgi:hypothetical protein
MIRRLAGFLILAALSISALGQSNKLEAIGANADPGASDALKKVLEPRGSRITIGDGPYCDIWLRAGIPAGKSDALGAVYTTMGESVLVGVISFTRATTDFRGQAVKPGTYTLRYAVHPADGNHLGISPVRDFLAMVPVALDQNPEAQPKYEELMKMSAKVAGTNHPAVLSLVQAEGGSAPKLGQEGSHVVFSARITQGGGDLPIAFIVKGIAEQ